MHLSSLIASGDQITLHGEDRDITGITNDSRKVEPGFLFIATPGTKQDGRQFIDEAVKRGAVAVLTPPEKTGLFSIFKKKESVVPENVSHLTAPDIRIATSSIAAIFYPKQPEIIAAVTGTSGKTSTAQFTREIWQTLGLHSASVGTLGVVMKDEVRYGSLTTPDPIVLHQTLNEIANKGVTHLAMEASSHGLALHRLDHVRVKVAGFTNLSRDHLDFHDSMDDYFRSKQRLFNELMDPTGTAVLNADIPEYEALLKVAQKRQLKVISYGLKAKEIKLLEIQADADSQALTLELFGQKQDVLLPVIGKFQVWNSLCALGLVIASGADQNRALAALAKVTDVPGRLQFAGLTKTGGSVFVDYAHKPDALENVLNAARSHIHGQKKAKLGVVFGCGGNRDKGKRPVMGEIAQRLADWVIVTDDNPRHEEPAAIRKEILAGCKPSKSLKEIGDRAEAIAAGIKQLKKGDVMIIAGKGHESGQTIGDKTLPFDDMEVTQRVLQQ